MKHSFLEQKLTNYIFASICTQTVRWLKRYSHLPPWLLCCRVKTYGWLCVLLPHPVVCLWHALTVLAEREPDREGRKVGSERRKWTDPVHTGAIFAVISANFVIYKGTRRWIFYCNTSRLIFLLGVQSIKAGMNLLSLFCHVLINQGIQWVE